MSAFRAFTAIKAHVGAGKEIASVTVYNGAEWTQLDGDYKFDEYTVTVESDGKSGSHTTYIPMEHITKVRVVWQ